MARPRARAGAVPAAAGVAVLIVAATATAFGVLLTRVVSAERRALAPPDASSLGPRAAVVVFGGRFWPDGPSGAVRPSGEVRARLEHARRLWADGVAGRIVVSGGIDDVADEVAAMTDYLVRAGVPAGAVLPGRPGDNTRQTLGTMRRLSQEDGLGPYVAVSSAYHARRIRDEARRAGVGLTVSAPPDAPEAHLRHVRRVRIGTEVVGTAWYALPAAWTERTPPAVRRLRHAVPLWLAQLRRAERQQGGDVVDSPLLPHLR